MFENVHGKSAWARDACFVEPCTYNIRVFGDTTFANDDIYLGIYSATANLQISLCYSFNKPLCATLLKKELKAQYLKEHGLEVKEDGGGRSCQP